MAHALVVASTALAPGIHAWWTGRTLIGRTADPAFPELVFARRQMGIRIIAASTAILIVFAATHAIWSVPMLVIAALAGGYPFRRALYSETWSLLDYIGHAIASIVGGAGFWILLAFAPGLSIALARGWASGRPDAAALLMGALLGVVLLVWEWCYARVWLALHRATPLERPDLQSHFDEMIRRAGMRPPGVFRYGAAGSYAMNAVALPSMRAQRVAFGDTLLEMLAPDEIAAIFVHEIAHLEQYDRRMLVRVRVATYTLVLAGAALPAVLISRTPVYATTAAVIWPLLVMGMLMHRLRRNQTHETESDRRSAELMGDPEPMVRALTKLHHYSRLPRRWPYDFERSASHPSLARRIQALRATSAGPAVVSPTVLRTTTPDILVALDATRIFWFEGVPTDLLVSVAAGPVASAHDGSTPLPTSGPPLALLREHATSYRAIAYSDLTELRVGIAGAGRTLQVRDRRGKKWSTPLLAADVAVAQATLDLLDGQLAPNTRSGWSRKARTIAALTIMLVTVLVGLNVISGTDELELAWTSLTLQPIARVGIDGVGSAVILSPDGRNVAIRAVDSADVDDDGYEVDEDGRTEWRYVIADSGGARRTTLAWDAAFAGENRLLVLRAHPSSSDSMMVSLESATDADSTLWRRTLPTVAHPVLRADQGRDRWTILGQDTEAADVVVVSGSFTSDSVTLRHASYDDLEGLPLVALPDGGLLVTKVKPVNSRWMILTALGITRMKWEVWRVDARGRRLLGTVPGYPDCSQSPDAAALLCIARGRDGTSLFRIDDEGMLAPLGMLPRELDVAAVTADHRIVTRPWSRTGEIGLLNVDDLTANQIRIDAPGLGIASHVRDAAAGPGMAVVLLSGSQGSEIRFYRLH